MSTIVWNVSAMNCYPQAEGETDVVFTVHWRCNGTQEQDGKTYNGSVYSTCGVTYTAGTPYTPYADLTQDQVLGWIWASGVDKNATEAVVLSWIPENAMTSAQQCVQGQIDSMITPPVSPANTALPWSA